MITLGTAYERLQMAMAEAGHSDAVMRMDGDPDGPADVGRVVAYVDARTTTEGEVRAYYRATNLIRSDAGWAEARWCEDCFVVLALGRSSTNAMICEHAVT